MAELGSAYVNIIPKAPGIERNLKQLLNDNMPDTSKQGRALGQKLGGGIMSGLKTVVTGAAIGTAVAGAAMGKVVKDAFSVGAEYEQLAGGVEKIFADMDTSKIFKDANKAFKNLNLSANDYLAVINDVGASFSATMGAEAGYETAKKGLQAISDYASGTGKSVDLLSQKFTMISRSTSSYMSIADQFSGILPATSADFLAQAKAANLLSESYTELSQVPIAEYQQAIASMLELGVEKLNLAGNTAAETATTLTGSLGAVKASWDNVLVAMTTGEGLDEAMANLQTSVGNLSNVALETLNTFAPQVPELIKGIGAALVDNAPDIIANGTYITAQMAAGLINGIGDFNENWPDFKESVAAAFEELDWSFLGTGMVGEMLDGAKQKWEDVKSWWAGVKDSLPPGSATINIGTTYHTSSSGREHGGHVGEFAAGLNYVPYDEFPALLHQGEMVVPRRLASQMRAAGISKDSQSLPLGVVSATEPTMVNVAVEFRGSLAQLGRLLQPCIQAETVRVGAHMAGG